MPPADESATDVAPDIADAPEIAFDAVKHDIVLDLAALAAIPFDPEREGVRAFRALVFPE